MKCSRTSSRQNQYFIFSALSSYLRCQFPSSVSASFNSYSAGSAFVPNSFSVSSVHSYTPKSPTFQRSYSVSTKLKEQLFESRELPPNFPRHDEIQKALVAIRRASQITTLYQPETTPDIATLSKADDSPVTLADFAVQAVILHHLNSEKYGFIAEESSLEVQSNPSLTQNILEATQSHGIMNASRLYKSIDVGKSYLDWFDENSGIQNENKKPDKIWVLDPIDGTKGFLRGKHTGGQYCIALALLENGIPTIGILSCPNLPTKGSSNLEWNLDEISGQQSTNRGCIFVASQGGGCYQLPLFPGPVINHLPLQVTFNQDESERSLSHARFCIGVERSFGDYLNQTFSMAELLHAKEDVFDDQGDIRQSIRIDSQAKFGVIGRGDAEYYVRLPRPDYQEWIWDQAAGYVVLQECGGEMTDTCGKKIDFSLGPKLGMHVKGVLGSNGSIFHKALVAAYKEQEDMRETTKK